MKPDPKFGYHAYWIVPAFILLSPYFLVRNAIKKLYLKFKYRNASKEVRRRYLGYK